MGRFALAIGSIFDGKILEKYMHGVDRAVRALRPREEDPISRENRRRADMEKTMRNLGKLTSFLDT